MTQSGERLASVIGAEMAVKGSAKMPSNPSPVAQGCVINSESAIAVACARKLQAQLGVGHIGHQLLKHATGASSLHFTIYPPVNALVNGVERPVLPLDDGIWLHLAIDLEFIVKNRWRLRHISIDVLEGEATHLQKASLFRAEWMMHDTAIADGHAQPHWHVIGAAGIKYDSGFEDFLASGSGFGGFLERDNKPPHLSAFRHFHYAMVTGWHHDAEQGHCHTLASQDSALAWIIGCVGYIKHQLAHVSKKGSTT